MSVDPVAAGAADLAALIDAELASLAADAQALAGFLSEGTVVQARVLPPNGLTDLLEIGGLRVAAALPPTVRPGEVLTVRVTGFQGDQIQVQIIPPESASATLQALAPPPSVFTQAAVIPAPPPAPAAAAPPEPLAAPLASTPAPPPAAGPSAPTIPAMRPAAAPGGPITAGPPAAGAAARAGVLPRTAEPPPSAPARPPTAPAPPTSIEARVAAARAAVGPPEVERAAPEIARATPPPPPGRFVAPPQIAGRAAVATAPATPPGASGGSTVAAARAGGLQAYRQPVALLRALNLPVTPTNVAAATTALEHPERLPDALAALERALPRASSDPAVATLRTLLSFVGSIEPDSPVLAAQLSAYVDQIVDGAEPKLATLAAALRAASPLPASPIPGAPTPPAAPPPAPAPPAAPAPPGSTAASPPLPPPEPATPTVAAAVAVERAAALGVDLKQAMLTIASSPQTSPALGAAVAGALTALTAVQTQATQLLAAQPNGVAFAVPLVTPDGRRTAQISITGEGSGGRAGAEQNFRIAFILETAHYGTIGIDLVTAGRDVTVDVRAETGVAVRAFRDRLGSLTARLEALHYRVASAEAKVGTPGTIAVAASAPVAEHDPDAAVDRSA